jgi:alginate O-acetyltransferase complex protein AlgI
MLFNSFTFIFLYLPLALGGYFWLGRRSQPWAAGWLALASLAFYAYWNPRYTLLLLASIGFNYLVGRRLSTSTGGSRGGARLAVLAAGVVIDLGLLGYYKYANFFIENLNALTGAGLTLAHVILPLGISFFTFTQIAFLVDAYRGEAHEPKFVHYVLFVSYFPHLIAGPILHHKEMMPQFRRPESYRFDSAKFATGVTIFCIGLVKKAVLADGIAVFVGPIFAAADAGSRPLLVDAWAGALAYTLQLYFDFSGYCDMAIGVSWMLGIALPLNFNSPYKSRNIVDFWRRWHMTLSRFLRDYLYVSLGGNRRGPVRRYLNLFLTMLIGGLWHGAGWTFVAWGALHGFYLICNHAWGAIVGTGAARKSTPAGSFAAWLLTFLAVVVGWVLFRAHTIDGAGRLLAGMIGLNGWTLPAAAAGAPSPVLVWLWCVALGAVALAFPNTQELLREQLEGITRPNTVTPSLIALHFVRSAGWAAAVAVAAAAGIMSLPQPTNFLYFNF